MKFKNGGEHSGVETAARRNQENVQEQKGVNTEALIVAREMSGITQTELARISGFSQAKISRFEDAISVPGPEDLAVLAKHLAVPARLFTRFDVKRSIFNSFYRKRKSVPQKVLMQFNSRVCFRQVQIDRLMRKVDLGTEPVPRFDMSEYKGGMKQVAAALRQLLKLPPGPIRNLIPALEDIGVVVVMEDFGITKIDGVSTFSNHGAPIIFLNSQAPASRRRFSLAHEFAHTALHEYVAPDADEQADGLAAEFLMPEDDIYPDLAHEPITLARLANLKLRWKTSMASILYRAKTLSVIQPRRYVYLCTQMSAAGYRIREPHEELLEDEKPSLEKDLVDFHRNELGYSIAEIADSLDISESEVTRRYGLRDDLRVM